MDSAGFPLELVGHAVAALNDGVVVTDPNLPGHPIVWVNDGFLELTGYRRDEIVGRNCRFLQGPGTDQKTVDRLRVAIAEGVDFHEALLNYRKDGTAFWNSLSVAPVRGVDGTIVNFVAAQSDISGVKQLEEQMRHAEKVELVGRMAGGIAHDFNNVLTALGGYLSLLELDPGGEATPEYIAEMHRATDRAKRLTDRLLNFSRKRDATPEQIDLNETIDGLRGMLEPIVRGHAELRFELTDKPLPVHVDLGQLERVIVNLVVNARDASSIGKEICVTTHNGGSTATVIVEDEGQGMDEETRRRIFEPFFTTKADGKGTGLGLANVHEIVTQVGGEIAVESTLGSGTRFTISLPLDLAA